MRVVITGATGFIGIALCQEMLGNGHEVTAVIRPNSVKRDKIPQGVQVIELALKDIGNLTGIYDVFYHLAWNGSSGTNRNNFAMQQSNISYTVEAIRAAKRCGCKKFIGAGSQAEYGVVKGICTEETTPHPFMMYGAAKLSAYSMGKIIAEEENISFVWARIYSVYGVGDNKGTLISYLIDTLKKGQVPQLSPCENMWDFMYIEDCTAALRILGENKETQGIYNVSDGNPKPLKEFVMEARDIIAPKVDLNFGARTSDEKRTFWLEPDIKKLLNLNWEKSIKFKEGIRKICLNDY